MTGRPSLERLLEKIEHITECSICTETLTDPRCLPCVHSFCLKCLQDYGKSKKVNEDKMECPLCRKRYTLNSDGFEGLPVNHFINKLIDVNRSSDKEESGSSISTPLCDICLDTDGQKPAEGYCVDCMEHLCNVCLRKHRIQKSSKSHKTVTLDQKPSSDILLKMSVNYCQTHLNQELSLYCADCQTASCVICYVAKHKEHKCSDILSSSTELSQQIDQCTVKIMDQMGQTEHVIKQVDLTVDDFEKQIKATEESITQKYEEMKALLASQHKQLLDQLREFRSKRLKELKTLREESELELIMMKSFESYWNEVKEKGSACDILQAASSLHKRAEELVDQHEKQHPQRDQSSQSSCYKVEFIHTEASDKCTNLLGQISECAKSLQLNYIPDWRSLLKHVEAELVLPAGGPAISVVTIHKEELFIVRWGSTNIEVYNGKDKPTNKLSRQISVPGLTYPAGIIACGVNNCLYVSDSYSSSRIHRICLGDDSRRDWPVQSGQPWGLSLTNQHHLLVSMCSAGCIDEYDTTGRLVRKIQLSGDIQGIRHAIELKSGQLVVAEYTPQSRVHVVDSSGAILHTYGQGQGSSAGQLSDPRHISADEFGNILVADFNNHKLRVFDNTLLHLGDISTAAVTLKYPWCVHWDKQNERLLVGKNCGRLLGIKIHSQA